LVISARQKDKETKGQRDKESYCKLSKAKIHPLVSIVDAGVGQTENFRISNYKQTQLCICGKSLF
jgi:hypothetical protein